MNVEVATALDRHGMESDMWFPYSLPVRWRAESEPKRIQASLADTTPREFLIGFYLHNPITREWQVELQLTEPHWIQVTDQGGEISVGYYPSATGQLAEIICRIEEATSAAAVRRCYAFVSRTLSCWSALKGRGFAVLGFKVADLRHEAKWRALPHRPSVERFEPPARAALPTPYWTLTTLYREARNSASDVYRLLCCHKILWMWIKRADPFGQLQVRASQFGMQLAGDYQVTEKMLALSGLIHYRPELEGVRFADLLEPLATWRRWALQAVVDEDLPDQLGEYEHGRELSSVANLVDMAVHHILADELRAWQKLAESQAEQMPRDRH
jgi:hypothetical protein